MSISGISSAPQAVQQPRMSEAAERGPDNDGDADDKIKAQAAQTQAVQSAPPPNRAQVMDIKA